MAKKAAKRKVNEATSEKNICGVVMPISAIDNCSEQHWVDVFEIISEAIQDAGFEGNLVSNADDVGIIHKRIIQNLYTNPIVVVDVSGKNPNVMFELGVRLAFDKPTIILKDDKTSYSFDTSSIEHLEYPRDLRFSKIIEFKKKLADKIKSTYEKSEIDPEYSTFLKQFGEFKVAKIEEREGTAEDVILDKLNSMELSIQMLEQSGRSNLYKRPRFSMRYSEKQKEINACVKGVREGTLTSLELTLKEVFPEATVIIQRLSEGHSHVIVKFESTQSYKASQELCREIISDYLEEDKRAELLVQSKIKD